MAELAIIGLGRFGRAVASGLVAERQGVLAIDVDPARLAQVAEMVDATVVADTTDEEALAALQLDLVDCVVVAIGSRATEASLLTTALLAQQRVPRVVARAFDERHARLLLALGAHEVINPEHEIGRRLALRLAHPAVRDRIGEGATTVVEVVAPEAFAGRTVAEIGFERRGVHVLAILRDSGNLTPIEPAQVIESGDRLVLLGAAEALHDLANLL
jgi:trk system potassium uptake protein TrkA